MKGESAPGGSASSWQLGMGVAATGAVVIAASLTISSGPEAWGPRTFPILGGLATLLAGLAITRERSARPRESAGEGVSEAGPFGLIVLAAGYILSVGWVGYLVATMLAAPLAFALFGVRSGRTLVLAALLCPVLLFLFFFRLLGVFPPYGAWFDLADVLPV